MFSAAYNHSLRRRQLLCALLYVCSWRGPIPIVHHHDQLSDKEAVHQSHVVVFHDQIEDEQCDQWHWHLITPSAIPDENRSVPTTYFAQDLLSLACTSALQTDATAMSTTSSGFVSPSLVETELWSVVLMNTETIAADAAPSFLASLMPSACLVAVTGVCLI